MYNWHAASKRYMLIDMRINKYVAQATGMSRRAADNAIGWGRVTINNQIAAPGSSVNDSDQVALDNHIITPATNITILFHKPAGYVVSRDGQGSKTVYDLLPDVLHQLKPVGRLDKDSSGLLLMTNDGGLANELTHPSKQKAKTYLVTLNTALQPLHRQMISDYGVVLDDGPSKLQLARQQEGNDANWVITMTEGRNRQIRRTFWSLGYTVTTLHRTKFGPHTITDLLSGEYRKL